MYTTGKSPALEVTSAQNAAKLSYWMTPPTRYPRARRAMELLTPRSANLRSKQSCFRGCLLS